MHDTDHVKERLEAVARHLRAEHYRLIQAPAPEAPASTRTADESRPPGRASRLRARKVAVNGRVPWVLEDDAGIVEVADCLETLTADHPHAAITVTSTR